MDENWTVLHLHSMHSNPYSGLEVDSITSFQQYINRARECGMRAIAFSEHGSLLDNIAKKQACEKAGIKYIHGEEFYITESIDTNNLVRDNYHCILLARNYDGVREINKLSSDSFNREDGHFYYNPRITLDELINTSDNVLILTACVAGILCKGTPSAKQKFFNFILENKDRVWLEVQPHTFDLQIQYNRYLAQLSFKYNLNLIATNDIHALNPEQMAGRKIMQKSKDVEFHDEDDCDLTWKTYDEIINAFQVQQSLAPDVYMKAIHETNRLADLVEDYQIDYSKKYPRFENAEEEFKRRINKGIVTRGIHKLPNFKTEYLPRIKEEFETYKHNDAIDFMLLDSDYKNWMLQNGMRFGPSRGSVSGSVIAYLINSTDVDSIKYKLNFSRFMNPERVSLADVDTDLYASDRYKVREYLFERPDLYCCNILTYNTIKIKSAIKDIGRALGMRPDQTQALSDMTETDEKGNDIIPQIMREEYPELTYYCELVNGTITSLGRHAAGIVCSPTDIRYDFGTLSISSDPRPVSQVDMHCIDSINSVKLDLLGLNALGLIQKTCELANIPFLTPDNVDFSDENVINSIAEDTTMIFQFESGYASDSLKRTLSKETIQNIKAKNGNISYLDIISMVSGAIRPAGESYREQLFTGVYKDNGNEELNKFLAPTLGYLVYQEQIIDFLHDFCGFTMGQADLVRRHFAKKTGTELDIPIIENGGYLTDVKGNRDERYIKGFVTTVNEKFNIQEPEARAILESFLVVIKDASDYLFSRNHAIPYSMIGFDIGYLRYYHLLELLTAALIVYAADTEKTVAIKEYAKFKGVTIKGIKYGKSKADYFMDKSENTIYQGISSIKYCNVDIGERLYTLSQNKKYNDFFDLLQGLRDENVGLDARQLNILTGLGFFNEFGNNQYLIKLIEIFNNFANCKVIKKEKIKKLNLNEEFIAKFCDTEATTQYGKVHNRELINALAGTVENKSLSLKEQILFEKEYLEHIEYTTDKAPSSLWYIDELIAKKDKNKPSVILYNIRTGEYLKTKVLSANSFIENPFKANQFLLVHSFKKKKKSKLINGKWVQTNETEQILESWTVY